MSNTAQKSATSVLADGFAALECPRWHDDRLYVSDLHGGAVHAITMDGRRETVVELDDIPAGLGWLPDGRLLVVAQTRRHVLRLDPDGLAVHADLSGIGEAPINDMHVDAAGRAYVSYMGLDFWEFQQENPDMQAILAGDPDVDAEAVLRAVPKGQVIKVDPDGTHGPAAAEMTMPNGIVGTPGGRGLVVAESFGYALSVFGVDAAGDLTAELRVDLDFVPDGLAADADGGVWAAAPLEGGAVRVGPDGAITDRVQVGGLCLAVALGGADGRTLFACTAPTLDPAEAKRQMGSGVRTVRVDVPALAA